MYTVSRIIAGILVVGVLLVFGWWGFGIFVGGIAAWSVWHRYKRGYWPGDEFHPNFKGPYGKRR